MSNETNLILNAINGLKSDVSEMKSELSEIKSDVLELKTDVSELKSDVSELKSDMAEVKSDIENLGNRVDVLETKFDTMQDDVTSIKLTQENVTNKSLQAISEGHFDLLRKLREAQSNSEARENYIVRFNIMEDDVRILKAQMAKLI